jgi:hypothetical protein
LRKQRTQDLLFGDLGPRKGSPQLPNEILGIGVVYEYLGYVQVSAVGEGGEITVYSKAFHKHTHMQCTVLTTKSAYVNAGPWERFMMSKRRASCSAEIFMPAQYGEVGIVRIRYS